MDAAETVLRWLVEGGLAVTAALLLVLLLRHPLRRAFGARVPTGVGPAAPGPCWRPRCRSGGGPVRGPGFRDPGSPR